MLNGESKNRLPEEDRKGGTGSERGNERKAAMRLDCICSRHTTKLNELHCVGNSLVVVVAVVLLVVFFVVIVVAAATLFWQMNEQFIRVTHFCSQSQSQKNKNKLKSSNRFFGPKNREKIVCFSCAFFSSLSLSLFLSVSWEEAARVQMREGGEVCLSQVVGR